MQVRKVLGRDDIHYSHVRELERHVCEHWVLPDRHRHGHWERWDWGAVPVLIFRSHDMSALLSLFAMREGGEVVFQSLGGNRMSQALA